MGNIMCVPLSRRGNKDRKKKRGKKRSGRKKEQKFGGHNAPEAPSSTEHQEEANVPKTDIEHEPKKSDIAKPDQSDEIDTLKKQIEENKTKLRARIAELERLSVDKDKVVTENKQLKETNKELKGTLDELNGANKKLRSQNDTLKILIQPTDDGLTKLYQHMTEMKAENESLRQKLVTCAQALNDLHMDKQELKQQIKKLSDEKAELCKKLRLNREKGADDAE